MKVVIPSFQKASSYRYVPFRTCRHNPFLQRYASDPGVQGLLQLMEPEARIISRPKDKDIVEKAMSGAAEQYKSATGEEVSVSLTSDLSDNL